MRGASWTVRWPAAAGPRSWRRSLRRSHDECPRAAYVGAIAVIVVAAVAGVRAVRQMTAKAQQLEIGLAADEFIPPTHSSELALSPDGTLIAYASMKAMGTHAQDERDTGAGGTGAADMGDSMPAMSMAEQIYVRPLAQDHAKPIGGALGSAPFFSPDGKWLGFWHAPTGTLRKVALTGGAPIRICNAVSGIAGGAWGPDDTIVFAWFDLFSVPASGGTPKLLLKVDEQRGERFYRHPFVSAFRQGRVVHRRHGGQLLVRRREHRRVVAGDRRKEDADRGRVERKVLAVRTFDLRARRQAARGRVRSRQAAGPRPAVSSRRWRVHEREHRNGRLRDFVRRPARVRRWSRRTRCARTCVGGPARGERPR